MSVPRKQRNAAVEVINRKIYDARKISNCSATVEEKVYMVDYEKTSVYNPREGGGGERLVQMVSQRLSEGGGSKDKLNDMAHCVCVVEDVLFAFFNKTGLMWFDTTLNVWRTLFGRDGKELTFILDAGAMAEYEGRLMVLYMGDEDIFDVPVTPECSVYVCLTGQSWRKDL
ncbi:hypothetical protein DY000_02062454 [Brassica cretica]|uniref:Uncharacterized protein n=1 Tax=Brassica cretica TaxID=69181 RepID=A0ABQ7AQ65_BRACR|nr:hypothetical protein DY000_02062454 [Brassica cretica]